MGIITTAVFASTHWDGLGFFEFDKIPYKVKVALKTVTKKQRHKFRQYGIIPVPVLEALWIMGFIPGDNAPAQGMEIFNFIEFLRQSEYENKILRDNAKWLYQKILKEEVIAFKGRR